MWSSDQSAPSSGSRWTISISVAVGVFNERVATAAGFGVAVVLDALVHQLLVVVLEFVLGDSDGDMAPGVADLDVLALVVGNLEHRTLLVHLLGAEVDDGEPVALEPVFLLVLEVGLVPVERLLEIRDADHRVVERSVHTRTDGCGLKKRGEGGGLQRKQGECLGVIRKTSSSVMTRRRRRLEPLDPEGEADT